MYNSKQQDRRYYEIIGASFHLHFQTCSIDAEISMEINLTKNHKKY